MKNMMDRAMHYIEQDISRAYTLTELRRATGIAIRSQYRLAQELLDSGMIVRDGGNYRVADHLRGAK